MYTIETLEGHLAINEARIATLVMKAERLQLLEPPLTQYIKHEINKKLRAIIDDELQDELRYRERIVARIEQHRHL